MSNADFLVAVPQLFEHAQKKGINVRSSIKRLVQEDPVDGNMEFDAVNHPHYDVSKRLVGVIERKVRSQKQYSVVVRLSCGTQKKKKRLSTQVDALRFDEFWQQFTALLKSSMSGLVKKKKKKAITTKDSKKSKKKSKKISRRKV